MAENSRSAVPLLQPRPTPTPPQALPHDWYRNSLGMPSSNPT